jgi:hypothetical protein
MDVQVISLHSKDDTWKNRGIALEFTLHFDHVLDSDRLRYSLQRLLEIGEWKKLGARLRLNVDILCILSSSILKTNKDLYIGREA